MQRTLSILAHLSAGFSLRIRKQGLRICAGGKERAGKWEQLTEGKVSFFPRFYYTLDSH